MTTAEHITRAAAEFEAGRPRYWVKTDDLQRTHRQLYRQARAAGYVWRFEKVKGAVMIAPKGK